MGIMDIVRKFSEKKKIKSEKYKALEEDYMLQKTLEERQKSANERELERHFKEEREANIKKQLDHLHKKQNAEAWKPKMNILDSGTPITRTDRPIIKEKNLFLDKKNNIPFVKGEQRMFFKR